MDGLTMPTAEDLKLLDGRDRLAVSAKEGAILSDLIKQYAPETILEVGTGHGYSSVWFCLGMTETAKLYTVDEVHRQIIHSDKRMTRLRGTLRDNLMDIPDDLDFVFLDSDHQIHSIAADIEMLEPKMRSGTVVAVHDTIYCDEMGRCLKDYFAGIHSDRLKTIGIGPSKRSWSFEALETEYGLSIAVLGEAQ